MTARQVLEFHCTSLAHAMKVKQVKTCCCARGYNGWHNHLVIGKTIRFEKSYFTKISQDHSKTQLYIFNDT